MVKYQIKIWNEDFLLATIDKEYQSELHMEKEVKKYLIDNKDLFIEVQNSQGEIIHTYEAGVASHNRRKIYIT